MKIKYSDAIKDNSGEGTSKQGIISIVQTNLIIEEVGEALEREKRKNNLMIFGIEETNDQEATKVKINDIVKLVGIDETKVKYFERVGRLKP